VGDQPRDPGKIILGELGDIESSVRQLIRNKPLEVTEVTLPSGHVLRVPTTTPDETLRIKGVPGGSHDPGSRRDLVLHAGANAAIHARPTPSLSGRSAA
jgi:hypothetical protein